MADPGKQARSFLASLFDFSFSHFITLKLIRWLYALGVLLGVLIALAAIVTAFNVNSNLGVLAVLLSPVVFLLNAVYMRVVFEVVAIFFRIEENTSPRASVPR